MEKVYPAWRYHKDFEGRIVYSEQQDKELGEGWVDHPNKLVKEEPVEVKEKVSELLEAFENIEDESIEYLKDSEIKPKKIGKKPKNK